MQIVKYQINENDIDIGFKPKDRNYVVYASIGKSRVEGLSKHQILQTVYEEVKHALDYEEKRFLAGKPNSHYTEEVGESWTPESPRVKHLIVELDKQYIQFEKDQVSETVNISVSSVDQYNTPINPVYTLTTDYGVVDGNEIVLPNVVEPKDVRVTVTSGQVNTDRLIFLEPYVEPVQPEPDKVELLQKEMALLQAKIQANSEVTDFHEELIVELAMMLYQ